ncbi:Purine-cytosine permease fcyB [Penicillium rolfsii]|nr:Purine-cytosine permease fcyB [Penicillium rolfsii]
MRTDDIEKIHGSPSLHSMSQHELTTSSSNDPIKETIPGPQPQTRLRRWITKLSSVEARGIEPVPLEEREPVTSSTSLHMMLLWFSMSLATNNIIVGSMGTLVLGLSFKDAAICAVLGNLVGTTTIGYMSTWGPRSGNRTLIVARYFMGYYPSKVCISLNILTNLGYSMVNCVTGGQILSRISGGHISVLVGIVVVAFSSWTMAMFGMRIFQIYERFAWLPQLMVLCVMLGSAGPHFDFTVHTPVSPGRLNAKRVTFFSLALSVALAWAPLAADYYVYYPPHVKRWRTFAVTVLGSAQAMMITLLLGIGLGTMMASSPTYLTKYGSTPGGLLMAAYDALGGFGKFCAVINVLALVANNTPGAYSMGMNFQMLGGFFWRIPQPIFTTLATVIYTACAMGGRNSLYEVFKGFLPLIGYWVMIWLVVVIEEDVFFRRLKGYDWSAWNSPQRLPVGIAAGVSFLVGWAGAIIGMNQAYYSGLLAHVTSGADLGLWIGAAFTAVVFPPLRAMELWYFRR